MKDHETTGQPASGRANRNGLSGTTPVPVPDPTPGGFGLYIHWPFCVSKCPYCDFNSHVAGTVDQVAWQSALLRELHYYGSRTKGRRLNSVFFGGGTPSLMLPETAAMLLDSLSQYWCVDEDVEVTLEANPSSSECKHFIDFREVGVNRISIGVQSLNDYALAFLGRTHTGGQALQAVVDAQRVFDRVSFDLIYALPGQGRLEWVRELDTALAVGVDHLSLYQLTIERGTPFFAQHRNGAFLLPDADTAAELYQITADATARAGFESYEVSNYAKAGHKCRHNLIYWNCGDYVGIGPGAHGRLTLEGVRNRTEQVSGPNHWLSAVQLKGDATRLSEPVSNIERIEEYFMMGLRLREGIDRELFEKVIGRRLEECVNKKKVETFQSEGLIQVDLAGFRATEAGRLRLNALIAEIVQ